MKILGKEADLLIKRPSDVHGGVLQCSNNPGVVVIDLQREGGVAFLARLGADVFSSRFNDAIISSAVSNGPAVWPRFTSSNACRRRASMTRRSTGVYSSSAVGSLEEW